VFHRHLVDGIQQLENLWNQRVEIVQLLFGEMKVIDLSRST
jgi:hypothetical protein